MENFRHLDIWRRSHALSTRVNRLCRRLPWYEQLGLASQMRRAATSVPFNIAEACGRKVAMADNVDMLRQLATSSGSLHELDSQFEYGRDVDYFGSEVSDPEMVEIGEIRRMMAAFITRIRNSDKGDRRRQR